MEKYQDYVIKDGKFVGKFEEMYQKFRNPWLQASQDHTEMLLSRYFTQLMIKTYDIKSVVEVGCGLGYYSNYISQMTNAKILGLDISPTAISKAKNLWPHIDFCVDKANNIQNYINYDAILFGEITWYILSDLDHIMDKLFEYFEGKYLLQNLTFYKEGQQKYGCDFFRSLEEFIDYCPFVCLGQCSMKMEEIHGIDTGSIFRIEKKPKIRHTPTR